MSVKAVVLKDIRFHDEATKGMITLREGTVVEIVPFADLESSTASDDRSWAASLRRRGLQSTVTLIRWEGKVRGVQMGVDVRRVDERAAPPSRKEPRAATSPTWAAPKETP